MAYLWEKARAAAETLFMRGDDGSISWALGQLRLAQDQPHPKDPEAAEHWSTLKRLLDEPQPFADDQREAFRAALWALHVYLERENAEQIGA